MLQRFGAASVWDCVETIYRDDGLRRVCERGAWTDVKLLDAIGTGVRTKVGCYMDIITDTAVPEYLKMYTGQSKSLCSKLSTHYTAIESSSVATLHHYIATRPGRQSGFVVVGICDDLVTYLRDAGDGD